MSYKKSSEANRNALFGGGGGGGGGPKHKRDAASNRNALFGGGAAAGVAGGGGGRKPSAAATTTTSATATSTSSGSRQPNNQGYMSYKKTAVSSKKKKPGSHLSAQAKQAKLKEADEYKQKANKCMERGFFAKPDPVAASTYFKRAADCYQQVGDLRMERFYRAASGDCNMQVAAWASAASDFTRAAELVFAEIEDKHENDNDDVVDLKATAAAAAAAVDLVQLRRDAADFHKKAAEAWTQMNEKAKAAESQVEAALALNYGEDGTLLSKEAVAGLEEAVEAHVPDVLNPYARYRQTGRSAFIDPDSEETVEKPSAQTMELAESHIVSRAYSHEPLQELVYMFVRHGEYASALYAAGAATVILTRENMSTLSLSRAFCTETILQLAMGDPIAAEERFLNVHVQKTFYLSSRECKLSEELFRAIKMRDGEALEEARSPTGSNRAALANLHESLRTLVSELRLSGVARKVMPGDKVAGASLASRKIPSADKTKKESKMKASPAPPPPPSKPEISLNELLQQKTGYEKDVKEGEHLDSNDLQDELDALNFDNDDDDGFGGGDDELDELEDDDIDLR